MTFFYDLNKKIAEINRPKEQLNERGEKWIQKAVDPSHKGDLHKALHVPQGEKIPKGKIEKATHSKNPKLRHMAQFAKNVAKEDAVEEGLVDTVKSGAQAALQAIGNTLGHGSDEDMIRDLQKKAGVPQTGKVPMAQPNQQPGQQPMAEDGGSGLDRLLSQYSDEVENFKAGGDLDYDLESALWDYYFDRGDIRNYDADAGEWISNQLADYLGMNEGNAFSKAVVDAKRDGIQPGEKISVGGKEYPVKEQGMAEGHWDDEAGYDTSDPKHPSWADRRADLADRLRDEKKYKDAEQAKSSEPDVKEGWADMMKDVERRRSSKTGDVERGHKHDIEHTATGRKVTRRVDDQGMSVGADDDTPADGEKRGRGRPKKTDKKPERVTAKAYKHKGGRKMSKEDIEEAIAALEECGYSVSPLEEKAVSKAQQRFMGMVHAAQKGEKPASKEVAKVAKSMKKSDAEDFAKTKHKGLPEKKKAEEVEETTTSGSVATATEAPKSKGKGGMTFGKGIYDSLDRQLETMISESMSISVNMNVDQDGTPHKNISVNAEDEDAEKLAQLLNLAGLGARAASAETCPHCGEAECGCEEMVDENSPDWPTEPETTGSDDPHLRRWAGGLNKPKSTGQTTTPVVNRDPARGSLGPVAETKETADLGMKLYTEYKNYKAK